VKSRVGAVKVGRVEPGRFVTANHRGGAPGERASGLARRSRLVRYLTVGYTLLIAYASLYPFDAWRGALDNPLGFLLDDWPHYYTVSDLALNVVAYGPLGFLLSLALLPYLSARSAALFATLAGTLLSIDMEVLQHFLPLRVSSNLDVLTNGLGAMMGAMLAVIAGERWVLSGHFYRLRQRVFLPGAGIDVGFVVLLMWLFTQLNPEVWLFGNGDLRPAISLSGGLEFSPSSYRWLETSVTAVNLAGVCLLVTALARAREGLPAVLLAFIATAFTLKGLGALALFKPAGLIVWLTPGAMLGLPVGLALYLLLSRMRQASMAAVAALLIALGFVLVNVAPDNPYLAASIRTWRHGHFLSFSGLTQLTAALWPALACGYLGWLTFHVRGRRAE
jgi:VanZ family protein